MTCVTFTKILPTFFAKKQNEIENFIIFQYNKYDK